jgi:uncharacterized membrane protein
MHRGLPISKLGFSTALLLVIAIAILLRIVNLGSRELWYDEVLSLLVSTGQQVKYQSPNLVPVPLRELTALLSLPVESSITEVLGTLRNVFRGLAGDVHPPLSFLFLHGWLRLFGNSEVAMRGLVALMSVGAIASSYGLGQLLLGHRGGLLLAALLASNPFYLFHSLNVRMYGSLVLWTTLSAWAMLQLRERPRDELIEPTPATEGSNGTTANRQHSILWSVILIASVAAGLLTQYLFAYWVITLGIFALVLDRRHWWHHGLRLAASVLITVPWAVWGLRQQLHNRPNLGGQFDQTSSFGPLQHLQDLAQTLGNQLLLGDWETSLPQAACALAGCLVILLLVTGAISLWRQNQRQVLLISVLLGIIPLILGLTADILGGKFTISFGGGRAMIFILPGCLLLVTAWIERAVGKWQKPVAIALLLLYLGISIADYSTRPRWMFHQMAEIIKQDAATPTLIAMNSQAWGHVLRLAYYIPPTSPVMLLTQKSAQLAPTLAKALSSPPNQYQRVLWLDTPEPVWSPPSTATEIQQVQQVLKSQFQLQKTQKLSGTMIYDQFTIHLYQRPASHP